MPVFDSPTLYSTVLVPGLLIGLHVSPLALKSAFCSLLDFTIYHDRFILEVL